MNLIPLIKSPVPVQLPLLTSYVTTAVMIEIMSTEPTTLKTEMCKQILYNAHVNDNICQVTWT